jgi:hypothetical protein
MEYTLSIVKHKFFHSFTCSLPKVLVLRTAVPVPRHSQTFMMWEVRSEGQILVTFIIQANQKQDNEELTGMKKILRILTFGLSGTKLLNPTVLCSTPIHRWPRGSWLLCNPSCPGFCPPVPGPNATLLVLLRQGEDDQQVTEVHHLHHLKVVKEYERAVIFRLGRLRSGGAKGPGLFFIVPCIDSYKKLDLRTVSFDVPPQEVWWVW